MIDAMNLLDTKKSSEVMAASIGTLDAYILWVNRIPMLSAEEELQLATEFRQSGNLESARGLVLAHLRFVVHIAVGYLGYGLPKEDLIQEGTIGLMKAVKRFDPSLGVRLASFAVHWIKAEIHEFVLRNWRIVKIATTKAQRKLFFNLKRATKRLNWFTNEEVHHLAKELSVAPEDVRVMEARMQNSDISFDGYSDDDADEHYNLPVHYLAVDEPDIVDRLFTDELGSRQTAGLRHALGKLDQRSRDILESRWLSEKKATLQELAGKYGVSAERVRQLEESAINKIKREVTAYLAGNCDSLAV